MTTGGMLLDWLCAHARTQGGGELQLDSGVQRGDAHRFYFARRDDHLGLSFSA
jgi:hypothetical protein